jgi:aspartate aminotransferase
VEIIKLDFKLSDRVQRIKPSPTLAITARAAELRAAGKDIIGLGAGEPDFDTPEHIKAAATKAIADGFTKYTAVDGTASLKQAIIDKLSRDNQLTYTANQVLVSCGGKQSFFNLTQALLNEGDEVIIPAPYWVSYPDMVLLADGKPVIVEADIKQSFKITPEQLEAAITDKTRLLVLNSPSNPSGIAYSKNELAALGQVLLKHPHVLVELYERCIVLNGVSKAYSMTGWRIGYAAGPENLIKAMKKIQSQSTSNPTSISQVAAEAALNGDQSCVKTMLTAFQERHEYVNQRLNAIEGITCLPSDGTFYAFPDVSGFIEKIKGINDDMELSEYLIEKAGVALVPGTAFGSPGYIRISFATSIEVLKDALDRIEKVIS